MKPADASLVLAPLFDRYAETLGVNPEGAAAVVVRDDKGRETLYVACRKGIVWVSHDQSAEMGLVLWSAVGVGEIGATATNDAGPGYVPVHRIKLTNPVVTLGKKNDQAQVRDFIKVVLANLDGK